MKNLKSIFETKKGGSKKSLDYIYFNQSNLDNLEPFEKIDS